MKIKHIGNWLEKWYSVALQRVWKLIAENFNIEWGKKVDSI